MWYTVYPGLISCPYMQYAILIIPSLIILCKKMSCNNYLEYHHMGFIISIESMHDKLMVEP